MVVVLLLCAVIVLGILHYIFPFAVINGQSMEPTFFEGDIILCRRVFFKKRRKYSDNEIYVFKAPYKYDEYYVIKRVSFSVVERGTPYLYMLGDNSSVSYDSRNYGMVDCKHVMGIVLFRIYKRRHK